MPPDDMPAASQAAGTAVAAGRATMPTLVVHLEAHVVDRGVWCDRCLLPPAVTVVVTLRDNPTRTVGRLRSCADCRHTVRLR